MQSFDTGISTLARQVILLITFGLSFCFTIVYLSRKRQLSYRYTLGWLLFGLLIIGSALPLLFLNTVSNFIGIPQLNVGLIVLGLVSVVISVEISLTLSKVANRQREIGLHLALASNPRVLTRSSSTLVIIPALNEEESIGTVLTDCRSAGYDCLVIDDGSTDRTAEVAIQSGAHVLTAPFNLGIGVALRVGFVWATQHGYSRVIQCDADGQHSPSAIATLIVAQEKNKAHLVIGSRFAGDNDYEVSGLRRQVMKILARRASKACGHSISDASSGFRCISNELLIEFATHYPSDYMDSYEALIVAGRSGYLVEEIFTPMNQRVAGTASNKPLRAAFHTIKVLSTGHLGTPLHIKHFTNSV